MPMRGLGGDSRTGDEDLIKISFEKVERMNEVETEWDWIKLKTPAERRVFLAIMKNTTT